jgi:hypothetical protein
MLCLTGNKSAPDIDMKRLLFGDAIKEIDAKYIPNDKLSVLRVE